MEIVYELQRSKAALREVPCRCTGSAYTDGMTIAAHSYAWHFGHLTALSGNVFRCAGAETETLQLTDTREMCVGD